MSRRRGPTRKARRRERRAANRHGFDDLGAYRAWRAHGTDTGPRHDLWLWKGWDPARGGRRDAS